jgi:hypothetical protein
MFTFGMGFKKIIRGDGKEKKKINEFIIFETLKVGLEYI